ncbi:hypothetical protein NFI96_019653 [Prochilodus magdalenae]|nr:hypothetical protein NFI96_019653 [Prochilodus magdalenae]
MESLSAHLARLCPDRVRALQAEVQTSLQAWEELSRSMAENRSRLQQFGHLRHFFRNYLAVISWTEDTRSRIFSESALRQGRESQGSMVELLDQQIEQKFQEFDLLAAAGKKLLSEDHHLAKMIKERMEELRSMLGWILVHWRAQKDQWLNRKRAEEPHTDAIYSEATVCSLAPQLESETSTEDQQRRTEGSPAVGAEGRVQLDNGYEVMKCLSPKSSETRSVLEDCTSPYLLLKEPSAPSLGGTVNLILSFTNSGDSQLQVQEADQEEVGESSEAVHRVSTFLHVKDAVQSVAPVYESMTLPPGHDPASFSPRASLHSSSSSPEADSASLELLPRNSSSSIFSSLRRRSKKRKKKKDVRRHTVQRIMGVEPSEEPCSPPDHEPFAYSMHTWPLKDKKKRKNERKSERTDPQLLDYVKNPLMKDIDAECLGGLASCEEAAPGHVKNHCRFLSLGSVLSFDLPKDMSYIPCIQDIITIGPGDSRRAAHQDQDAHTEHSTALSTFKLARSQPAPKPAEPKPAPPGEISLRIDRQDKQKIHIDAVSVYPNDLPPAPPLAEDSVFQESQTSSSIRLKHPTGMSRLHEETGLEWDQSAAQLGSRDPQPPEQNHLQTSTANNHVCPSVHTLIQDLRGHQYHRTKPTCLQPKRESPVAVQSHAAQVVLNFKANGREDSVDSGHSSSGSFKLCTETSFSEASEYPPLRRTLEKLSSLDVEEPPANVEPTSSPVDDPIHPDHQQFEQEEEELEDIWNQTNGYRQSICSDIMYQSDPTSSSSPGQQREPSPKERAVLVRKMITASAPNLLVAEFRLPSSIHTAGSVQKDWSPSKEGRVMPNGERRSWDVFPQQEQESHGPVMINETASEPVKLPELKDQQNYIYQYREEEEEEEEGGDKGGMKDQSMSLLSLHMDLDGDAQVPNPRVLNTPSPVSARPEFPSMEGTLERKHRLLLGGRRTPCRAWSSYHAVLYRRTLCFYQDRKDTMRSSVTSLPLNLTGAECVPAPEYTKKPNCFSLRLRDGSEYLLSASSRFMMKKWILRIQANAEPSESEAATTAYGSPAQSAFTRGASSPAGCQCRATCQCSTRGDGHPALPGLSRAVSSTRTKEIVVVAGDASHISERPCWRPEELSPTVPPGSGQWESHGVSLERRLLSQNPRALPSSLSPGQDCKRRSHSFTSGTAIRCTHQVDIRRLYEPEVDVRRLYEPEVDVRRLYEPEVDVRRLYEPEVDVRRLYEPEVDVRRLYEPEVDVRRLYEPEVDVRRLYKPEVDVRRLYEPEVDVRRLYEPEVDVRRLYEPEVDVRRLYEPEVDVRRLYEPEVGVRRLYEPEVDVRRLYEPEVDVRRLYEPEVGVRRLYELEVDVRRLYELEVDVRRLYELEVDVRRLYELEVDVRRLYEPEVDVRRLYEPEVDVRRLYEPEVDVRRLYEPEVDVRRLYEPEVDVRRLYEPEVDVRRLYEPEVDVRRLYEPEVEVRRLYEPEVDVRRLYEPEVDVRRLYEPEVDVRRLYEPEVDVRRLYEPEVDVRRLYEPERVSSFSPPLSPATYQRIKPCTAPPAGSSQNSGSSYSVTVFIGDGEKPSLCRSSVLSQLNSCRQQSISELPLRGYASLPRPHNKSVFRKFFGKKE